jgi:hypothetical protein
MSKAIMPKPARFPADLLSRALLARTLLCVAVTVLIIASRSFAQNHSPGFLWAESAGGFFDDHGRGIAVDAAGNVYVTGDFFLDNAVFGSVTLTNSGGRDFFVAKYDSGGAVLWAKSGAGGEGAGIAVDAAGNVYVTGSCFVAKYDGSGNLLWEKRLQASGTGIALDAAGNAYVTGYFVFSTAVFDSVTLTNSSLKGGANIFLVKYDSGGTVLWAKSAGGTETGYGFAIAVDAPANVYLTGHFGGSTATFGSVTVTNSSGFAVDGGYDIFVAKYESSGNVVWAKSAGGSNDYEFASGIAVDGLGNVYVTGSFHTPTAMFGNFTLTNSSQGSYFDIFLAKYDSSGNVLWAKSPGGRLDDEAWGIAVDKAGNAYVSGNFKSETAIFGSVTLRNVNSLIADIFVAKYDGSGNVLWAERAGGGQDDYGRAIAVDWAGNVYLTGYFHSRFAAFGDVTLMNSDSTEQDPDIFVAKLATPRLTIARLGANVIISWPSPSTGFRLEQNNLLGTINWTAVGLMPTDDGTTKSVTVSAWPGSNFYRLMKP